MDDLLSGPHSSSSTTARARIIHDELVKLLLLTAVAVAAFFVTRAIAANNHDISLRDAAEWYQRGQQQLETGDATGAIQSFRRATVKDRHEKSYVLALARALATTWQNEAAQSALLALREIAPEDVDVNLQLARLAASEQDVTQAIRYYHNTLYAPWSPEQAVARRRVRVEFIRFLLTHNQVRRGVSELVALSTDLPNQAAPHVEVGQLFAAAGEPTTSLNQFKQALNLEPENSVALAGAGQAAFQAGDYPSAREYLSHAASDRPDIKETREIVELVLSCDPLAARIGSAARRQRLADNLLYVEQRLHACQPNERAGDAVSLLRDEALAFAKALKRRGPLEQDTIESGVELIARMGHRATETCASPALRDRALVLIGQRHGVAPQ